SYLQMLPEKDLLKEYSIKAQQSKALAEKCLHQLKNPFKKLLFGFFLRSAKAGSALRENIKNEAVRYLALVRSMLLELGARLTAKSLLQCREDVFFLNLEELLQLVRDRVTVSERVRSRRQEYEQHCSMQPPPVVVGEFDPTAPTRADPETTGAVLQGLAVSSGRVVGRARVILQASGNEKVRLGEILVAPFSDPGWTPHFIPAAGIVMDLGGMLSHGSIIAREYGIPAVVNVGNATRVICNGQLLEVDGDRGQVRILDDHRDAPSA
ncbi:MAG: PEP-utilizing enzyme, partial [Planctomycetota bacterium]